MLAGDLATASGGPEAQTDGVLDVTHTAALLDMLFEDVVLVGGDPPASTPGRRVPHAGTGALGALVAALEATRAESVVVLAADLPFVSADLLLAFVAWPEADVVATREGGLAEPLCALYRRDRVLPIAREQLAGNSPTLQALLDGLEVVYLERSSLLAG